jgi:aminoglycoside 6'-N-acetyltransferase I
MAEAEMVEIRRVGAEDAPLLERVAADVFDAPIDRERLARFLSAERHLMVVALAGGEVVGQARAIIHLSPDQADELYIDNMGVTQPLWRQGIGGRLLDELLAWGREHGCDYAWLGTELDNAEARGLYESRGGKLETFVMYSYEDLRGRGDD